MFIQKEWESLRYSTTHLIEKLIVLVSRGLASETDASRSAWMTNANSQTQHRNRIRLQRKRVWRKWKKGPSARFLAAQKMAKASSLSPSDFDSDKNVIEKLSPENFIQYVIAQEYVDARIYDRR